MNLFEVNAAVKLAEDRLFATIDENGEVDPEALEAFTQIKEQQETVIESLILSDKNDKAMIDAIDKEIKTLQDRKKAIANRIEWREGYLTNVLDGNKFETARARASFRKSERVTVVDAEAIPEEYTKTKVEVKPDLTAIKTAIKSGTAVQGATLDTFLNIQIK